MAYIGKTYRFNSSTFLKPELVGKVFKVISENRLEVYNQDGSIMCNKNGHPYFTYSGIRSVLKCVDHPYPCLEPIMHLKKFSLT